MYTFITLPFVVADGSKTLTFTEAGVSNQINKVVNHPTLPITITAHEDRHIRFFDNNTGLYPTTCKTTTVQGFLPPKY